MLSGLRRRKGDHGLTIEGGCIVEILAEFLGIHGCTRDEKLQLRSEACDILKLWFRLFMMKGQQCETHLDQSKEDISAQRPLMRLVDNECRVPR